MSQFLLSCTTCATRGIHGDETEACFRYAPTAGFKAWGAASVAQRALGEAQWIDGTKVKAAAHTAGLPICTEVYAPTFPVESESAAEAAVEQMTTVYELAVALSSPLVVMTGGPAPVQMAKTKGGTEPTIHGRHLKSIGIAAPIAGIKKLIPIIENLPVRLAIEPHYGSNFSTHSDFERIFSEIDHPKVGITIDTGHFHSSKVDWRSFIRQFGPKIWNIHIKDQIDRLSVPIGTGEVDFQGYLEELHDLEYDGALAVELEVIDPKNLPKYIRQSHDYLSFLIRKVTGTEPV